MLPTSQMSGLNSSSPMDGTTLQSMAISIDSKSTSLSNTATSKTPKESVPFFYPRMGLILLLISPCRSSPTTTMDGSTIWELTQQLFP